MIENSVSVARDYTYDYAERIQGEIIGMANDLYRARQPYDQDPKSFKEFLTADAAQRNLPGAILIDKDSKVLVTAQTGIKQDFTNPPPDFLKNVTDSDPQIAVFPEANYVAAVIRLRNYDDMFLYVARLLDPDRGLRP